MAIACVQLTRASNAIGVRDHFIPMGDPANGPANSENYGEHRCRYTDGLQDDARVEVDVGVEFFLDKLRVLQCNLFKTLCDLEHFILNAQL